MTSWPECVRDGERESGAGAPWSPCGLGPAGRPDAGQTSFPAGRWWPALSVPSVHNTEWGRGADGSQEQHKARGHLLTKPVPARPWLPEALYLHLPGDSPATRAQTHLGRPSPLRGGGPKGGSFANKQSPFCKPSSASEHWMGVHKMCLRHREQRGRTTPRLCSSPSPPPPRPPAAWARSRMQRVPALPRGHKSQCGWAEPGELPGGGAFPQISQGTKQDSRVRLVSPPKVSYCYKRGSRRSPLLLPSPI